MKKQFPDRIEIFLALAIRRIERSNFKPELFNIESAPVLADESTEPPIIELPDQMPALFNYLNEAEKEKLVRLWRDYQSKTETEKIEWRARVFKKIGTDEQFIDEQIHKSHIVAALEKEPAGIQRIVRRLLAPDFDASAIESNAATKNGKNPLSKNTLSLERTVRRRFAGQFVALRDLKKITAFDRLSGAQMARLIRLNGIREVATACVRIEAVEAVAAFLRIFSAEDAQAVAAQLNALPTLDEARLSFAETIVQATLEDEPQPSAMLDWLGIRLLATFLCDADESRVRCAKQKLPLELAPRLTEIINEQRRETDAYLRKQIADEIERLAETLVRPKNAKT